MLVKIAASGLCGSDLNALDGKRSLSPFPVVLGHEAAGTVVEAGPGAGRLRPGDPVVLSILPSCGHCPACKRGMPNYCTTASAAMAAGTLMDGSSRLSWRGGERISHFLAVSSFAEYAVVPESGAVAVPPELPLEVAALISCAVLTGVGAVRNTAQVQAGSRVAVFGCGGVGLNIVQGGRIAGARASQEPYCRRHHRAKQAAGWQAGPPLPGHLICRPPHSRNHRSQPGPYLGNGCRPVMSSARARPLACRSAPRLPLFNGSRYHLR